MHANSHLHTQRGGEFTRPSADYHDSPSASQHHLSEEHEVQVASSLGNRIFSEANDIRSVDEGSG